MLRRLDLVNMSCFSGVGTPLLLDISLVQQHEENHSYVFLPTSKTFIFSLSNCGIQIVVVVLLMFGGGWVSQASSRDSAEIFTTAPHPYYRHNTTQRLFPITL